MRLLPGVVLCLFSLALLRAQTITGTILGEVKDSAGAFVANASVTVENSATKLANHAQTNSLGYYEVPYLRPGAYVVRVSHPGFKTAVRDQVALEVDARLSLDFALTVGDVATSVDVTAQTPMIDTETGSLGYVISEKTLEDMPVQGRNIFDMLSLAAGVQENPTATGSVASPGSFVNSDFSMNGGRMRSNEFLLDGVSIMLPQNNNFAFAPSPDSTLQFKIMTSNYGPQFGRTGGGTANVLTKGGTNELHGTLYEFHRDQLMRANNYFANARGQARGVFAFNQFGASAGGPIKRNRTFFFADYQGHRQWSSLGGRVLTIPGAAERTGDFSHRLASTGVQVTIYNPFSLHKVGNANVRDPFPGNIIPSAVFDPVAKKVLTYVPQPNLPGDGPARINNYAYAPQSRIGSDQWSARIDHRFSDANNFFGRVTRSTSSTTGGSAFGTPAGPDSGNDYLHNFNLVLNDTWTFGPHRILSLRYGLTRSVENRIPLWSGKVNLTDLGFPAAIAAAAQDQVFPLFTINGLSTFGNPSSNRIRLGNDIHTWVAEQTHMLGRHTLVYGADVRLYNQNPFQAGNPAGSYSFTQTFTQNIGQTGVNFGDGLASFLVGYGSGGSIDAAPAFALRNSYVGLFFNDDIRFKRLTINLGMRWDYEQPLTERYNRLAMFEFDKPFPIQIPDLPGLKGTVGWAGQGGEPRGNFDSTFKDFGPRVGIAYRLGARTTLRSGYGIFYLPRIGSTNATVFGTVGSTLNSSWVPSVDGITLNTPLSNPFPTGLLQPTPSLADRIGVGQSFRANNRSNKANSYTQQWNFSLQRSLWKEAAASASYAGSQGVRLPGAMYFNQVDPAYLKLGTDLNTRVNNPFYGLSSSGVVSTATVARYQMLRPYPAYNSVQSYMQNFASSSYHSMLLQLEKRFAHGYNFMFNYTFSKLMDVGSGRVVNYTAYEPLMQNAYDMKNERSVSAQDIPHRVVFSHTLAIPGWRYGITRGWNLAGAFTWNKGFPLALTATGSSTYLFNPATRPNSNGRSANLSGRVEDRLLRYFDTSTFSVPPNYTFGNVARTLPDVRSPSRWNDNIALSKTMKLTERISFLLRAEAFNLANTPFFDPPATTLGAGTFGIISSSRNERQLQFAAKILF